MYYQNFDLRIETRRPLGYRIICRAPESRGEIQGELDLDPGQPPLSEYLQRLSVRHTDSELLIDLGVLLFERLFEGRIGTAFQGCLDRCKRHQGRGIRLRLGIEAPELAVLPWELLYSRHDNSHLACLTRCPVIRYLPRHRAIPLYTHLPLRMLVVIPQVAAPYPAIEWRSEKNNLEEALQHMGRGVEVEYLSGMVTTRDLSDRLAQKSFHCCHFIGHGEWRDGHGFLIFSGQDVDTFDRVNQTRLTTLLTNADNMKLVVLNACCGASVSALKPMTGIAPNLVRAGIPAVVAMQFPVKDRAAVEFARTFYRNLFGGTNIGRVDYAVSYARSRLADAYRGQREIAAPVLFLLAPHGILFELSKVWILTRWLSWDTWRTVLETYQENRQLRPLDDALVPLEAQREQVLARRIQVGQSMVAGIIAVILITLFASAVQFLDLFHIDVHLATTTIGLSRVLSPPQPSPEMRLLVIDKTSRQRLGPPGMSGSEWRQFHARLVTRLAALGAAVVAFDMVFEESSQYDEAFAIAIQQARRQGTRVVLGYQQRGPEGAKLAPRLRQAAETGLVCGGQWDEIATVTPLAVQQTPAHGGKILPHLVTAMLLHPPKGGGAMRLALGSGHILQAGDAGHPPVSLPYSELTTNPSPNPYCPLIKPGDRVADLIARPFTRAQLDLSRRPGGYADLVKDRPVADPETWRGRLVLVGADADTDIHQAASLDDTTQLGVELYASALNALLQQQAIQFLHPAPWTGLLVLIGVWGAALRVLSSSRSPWLGRSLLLISALLLLGAAVMLLILWQLLLHMAYGLVCLFGSYWLAGRIGRRLSSSTSRLL